MPRPPPPPQPPPPATQPPHEIPPPYPYYNHHDHHHRHRRSKSSTTSFASCLLATVFLAVITVAGVITCFILFRPQDPQIAINSMKFPVFSFNNGTANFTLFQYLAVRNPNRYSFSHYDSSLQLLSLSDGPIGFVYIPAGKIAAGGTQYLTATFDVRSYQITPATSSDMTSFGGGDRPTLGGPTMELVSKMKLVGTVKVMKVFAHHVEKSATCRVTIQVTDGSVLGYHC